MERPRNPEQISPGQLFVLSHPGSDLFSGYGLTTHEGRKDRLIGLLMVDRPQPVDPAWLGEIEQRYGEAHLVAMTATGERGILTQMRIARESVRLLHGFAQPLARELTRALTPLLEKPPAPVLKLRWDEEQKLWRSDFWIGLPPVLQEVFEKMGYGCLAVERDDGQVAFVTNVAPADTGWFRDAPVLSAWQYVAMPTAPLIRYRAAIMDDLANPYKLEHFLNVADPEQARCLSRLVQQEGLTFDFYGEEYEYAFSMDVAHGERMRRRLDAYVRQAIAYYGEIPADERDFDRAKAEFQREFPL
jgi:hypothetical protein